MSTYVIGDIHGCYDQLLSLLELIKFDPSNDMLWFTGDLINGGPKPAHVLRFIKSLGKNQICVLGNHDLVLLALSAGKITPANDRAIGFEPVFDAPDHQELIAWLRMRPIIHFDPTLNTLLVHAGILPSWSLTDVQSYAQEVEMLLHGTQYIELYENMFGNDPTQWSDELHGWPRIRFILNCLTRMRFCSSNGELDLVTKGPIENAPNGFAPWFKIARNDDLKIIFGHWAGINGITHTANITAMDTGCVWGGSLSAQCLETGKRYAVANPNIRN